EFRRKASKQSMDNTQSLSHNAGQAQGQAAAKKDEFMDKASNTAQSVKDSMNEAGQTVMDKAHGAADTVKDATGMKK
ncbi:Late embryogenesis abundant protein (LEA) family protein, partial [Thalictrum thalictroides]